MKSVLLLALFLVIFIFLTPSQAKISTITSADISMVKSADIVEKPAPSVCRMFTIENIIYKENHVYEVMESFIDAYKKKHLTEEYCDALLESFTCLIEKDGSNIHSVLYFMAICSVESNFDQFVSCKYGVGITQVVYRVHKKYITELGVSKKNFYESPRHNIYVGYNIFKCYLKSCKFNWKKTATRYNGGATKGYADNVQKRFNYLRQELHKKLK